MPRRCPACVISRKFPVCGPTRTATPWAHASIGLWPPVATRLPPTNASRCLAVDRGAARRSSRGGRRRRGVWISDLRFWIWAAGSRARAADQAKAERSTRARDVVEALGTAGREDEERAGIEAFPGLEDDLLFAFAGRGGDEDGPACGGGGETRRVGEGRRGRQVVLDVAGHEDPFRPGAQTSRSAARPHRSAWRRERRSRGPGETTRAGGGSAGKSGRRCGR